MEKIGRIVFLDYLRLIACFMVMMVHSVEPFYFDRAMNFHVETSGDAFWVILFDSAARACVPLFVLASSYLLFPLTGAAGTFFKRRFVRILIPFFIWAIVYIVRFDGRFSELAFNFPSTGGHLWFVPMLMGLYLLMPLLSPWAEKASKREMNICIGVWLLTTLFPFARRLCHFCLGDPSFGAVPYLWGECPWNSFGTFHYVSGFCGYLLIGAYFRKFVPMLSWHKTLRIALPLWLFGMLVMIAGLYFKMPGNGTYPVHAPYAEAVDFEMSLEYCGLGVVASTIALFMLIRKISYDGWFYSHFIRLASESSYGTYLMHILILVHIMDAVKGKFPTPIAMMLVAVITFVFSTFLSCALRRIPKVGKYLVG